MKEPLVSILMNTYNCETYLSEAIESVISQTYQNWELIFWDNYSTDTTSEILNKYQDKRIKYYKSLVHTSLGVARYMAWTKVTGEFVAILDCDDVWFSTKLEKQINLFQSDEEVGIVISDSLFFSKKREVRLYEKNKPFKGFVFHKLLNNYFISLETVVFRKKTVEQLEYPFDPEFSHIADFDLILRTSYISKIDIVPEILAKWRVHFSSGSWMETSKFLEEKKKWINKMFLNKNWKINDLNALNAFKRKLFFLEIISLIKNNKKNTALKLLISQKNLNIAFIYPILMLIIPFSHKLLLTIDFFKRKRWF